MIYRTIIFAALCLLLAGCSRTDHPNPTLVAIESMMDEHPDSALMLLTKLDNKSLTNQADSALYNLLLVQAEDKNFIDRTSTERIDIAVNYYRQHSGNNDRRLMLALYYLGRIQENAQLSDLSIISMMEAEQLAQQQQDYFYLGLIYRSIANQYRCIYDFHEQLSYCKKACLAFELSQNLEYANYEKCNLAIALNYNQRYQEALDLLNVVDNTAKTYGDTVTIIEAKRVMVYSYYMLSKYSDAINCYQDLISYGDSISDIDRQEIAQLYDYAGDEAKTMKILSEVSLDYAGPKASIYNTYAQKGDYRNAFLQLKNYLHLTDSTYQCISQQRVTQSVFEYNKMVHERERQKAEHDKETLYKWIVGICLIVMLLAVALLILRIRYKNKVIQLHIALENINKLTEKLNIKSEEGATAVVKTGNVAELRLQLRNKFIELVKSDKQPKTVDAAIICSESFAELRNFIEHEKSIKDDDELWGKIEATVLGCAPNFKTNLQLLTGGKLSRSDYRTALLIRCGITPSEMAILLGRSKGAISSRREYLGYKIFDEKLGTKLIDDIIRLL
jgi:hypothetical protein